MARTPQDVTDTELAILQVLWDGGPATIRRLTEALYPTGSDAYYATVQKLLERLEAKGHVVRDRSSHAHRFSARTDRDALVGRRLRAVAEQLTGGLMAPLLTHLVRAEALTAKERQELRQLIDELDRRNGSTNFVKLADLRQALGDFSREEFDAGLRRLRMDEIFSLDSHEGLHGSLTHEEREAGVREAGSLLVYASRR